MKTYTKIILGHEVFFSRIDNKASWYVVLNDKEFVNVLSVASAAVAGATEDKTPNPNAATVTSAMRLKVVFVDICFLSIVDPRTIRGSA